MPLPEGTIVTLTGTGEMGKIVGYVGDYGVDVYRVKIKNAVKKLRADEFVIDTDEPSDWDKALGLEGVRLMLAEVKIVHPFRETLASYGATKTELHAYQFKPLMKLNRSGLGRILIADEVGLGKTIEAGYIVLELVAREPYLPVVVVCPPTLRQKWKDELHRRFGLQFEIMTKQGAARRVARRDDDPDDPPLRAIVSYDTIRRESFLEALGASEDSINPIGLLIADEAHRARNRATTTSKALELLVAHSQTAAFLTATPIQNKDEDLFRLLQILSPQDFPQYSIFADQRRANEIVVKAESAVVRAQTNLLGESISAFSEAGGRHRYRLITENPYFDDALARMRELRERLEDKSPNDPEIVRLRIELQDSLFKLNLLSPILNRTRRREVHIGRAKRSPMAVDACLTPYEQTVYDQLTNAVYTEYTRQHGEGVARFVLKAFQQGFASSLWAAVSRYRERFEITDIEPEEDVEDIELPSPEAGYFDTLAPGDASRFTELKRVLAAVDLDRLWREDSKWGLLAGILEAHRSGRDAEGRPRKMLVFSYFKRSLDLIEQRLAELGMTCYRIDGDVPTDPLDPEKDERLRRLRAFKESGEVQVLIASQVGTEGLDLQFCDTVVNWDLPWNPMIVEQRIGRIDRIGQRAEILHIVNVACKGTVEWEILQRLYNKIGIFRSSIGDLEEILGEVAQRLHSEISTTRLSEAERNARIEGERVVLENVRRQQEELEQEAGSLVTADGFLIDEFERIRRTGQCVQPRELERFVCARMRQLDPASKLMARETEGLWEFRAGPVLIAHADDIWRKTRVGEWSRFLRRMRNGAILCTFDGEKFAERVDVEVLSVAHPLLRVLVDGLSVQERACHAFRCRLASSELPPGEWVISVGLVSDPADERGARIMASATEFEGGRELGPDESDMLLCAVLDSAVDLYTANQDAESLEACRERADRNLYARFEMEQEEHRKRAELRTKRTRMVTASHHDRLIEVASRTLETTRVKALYDAKSRNILAANEARLRKAKEAKEIALAKLPEVHRARLELFEHFVGFVVVSALEQPQ